MASFFHRRGIGAASIAALAVVLLGSSLGSWQLQRADEKASMQLTQDRAAAAPSRELGGTPAGGRGAAGEPLPAPEVIDGARVQATGVFDGPHSVYLDNRTRDGVAGFHVLTPLSLSGKTRHVMVLRGWVPRDPEDRARLPALQTPSGPVRVEGFAAADLAQPMMLGEEPVPGPGDRLWQHFTFEKFSHWSGLALYPVILRQTVEPEYQDGLARDWNQPGMSVDRHRAYAFQWFALTAAVIVTCLILLRNVSRGGNVSGGGNASGGGNVSRDV